jgi:hypothetical protein
MTEPTTLFDIFFWLAVFIGCLIGLMLWMLFRGPPVEPFPDAAEEAARKRLGGE